VAWIADYVDMTVINYLLAIDYRAVIAGLLTVSIIFFCTFIVAKIADKLLRRHFLKIGDVEVGVEKTIHSITRRLAVVAIYAIGLLLIIFQIPQLHRISVAMLAGAGVAGIAIGFAAKDSLSNVISGIFLAVFQPFRVGDFVSFNGEYGKVEDLTLRHTVLCTWDQRRLIVPNSIMGNESIINWSITDPVTTWVVDIGIAYTADIDRARGIILEEAMKHPVVMKDHEIKVRLTELGDFAVNLRLYIDVPKRDVAFDVGCDVREAIKKRLDKEGIEIPYPYQNIIFHQAS
jgi:small conductance mechanosensitive channel